jgi:hypothetical protein
MSNKMYDDFMQEAASGHPKVASRVSSLVSTIADRIVACNGDAVKLSDLATVLRMDPDSIGATVATDPPVVAAVDEPNHAEVAAQKPAPAAAPAVQGATAPTAAAPAAKV